MKKLVIAFILFKVIGAVVLSGFCVLHDTINSSDIFSLEEEFSIQDLSENIDMFPDYDYQY